MNILDIEFKQDTEEKLAKVAGKPTENFLFSKEINKIVNAIKLLGNMITLNSATIDQLLANNIKIELGEVPDNLLDFINFSEVPIEIAKNAFLVYKIGEVNYVSVYTGETQSYGGGIEEQLTEENLVLLYESGTPSSVPLVQEIRGRISQQGANKPTLELTHNTYQGAITTARLSTGRYAINLAGVDRTKITTFWNLGNATRWARQNAVGSADGDILINTFAGNGTTRIDDALTDDCFQIIIDA